MEEVLKTIKKYWVVVLGTLGVFVVAIGTIFGIKKNKKSDIADAHRSHVSGVDDAVRANFKDEQRRSAALKEANEKFADVQQEAELEIKELSSKDNKELTSLVAEKFGFKNEDSK
jgi:F0F1-type ATP synthase membrane subunit b/b'